MEECKFCSAVFDDGGHVIAITLDGETLVSARICGSCKRAVLRGEQIKADMMGALVMEAEVSVWHDFCTNCPCNDNCETSSELSCPSIRKAIAEERE